MKKKLLLESFRIALEYLPRHPEYSYFPHYSFIVQTNKIIEWDTNSGGQPPAPFLAMYQSRVAHLDGASKRHSELNAFTKAKGLLDRDKSFEVINLRLNKRGEFRDAAPCSCCHHFLKMLGCQKVWFTTNSGWAKMEVD
jgi:hypothetical protein